MFSKGRQPSPSDPYPDSNPNSVMGDGTALVQLASQWIRAGSCVLDLGQHRSEISGVLPFGCTYLSLPISKEEWHKGWAGQTSKQLKEAMKTADVVLMLDVFEPMQALEKWIKPMAQQGKSVLSSYVLEGAGDEAKRIQGWGMVVEAQQLVSVQQGLIKFRPKREWVVINHTPRVHVLSHNNVGNFGDRLGYFLVNHLLPPNAKVTWGQLNPFETVPEGLDLLIVGIGNSLFGPLIHDHLIAAVTTAKRSIGIFGTQYQELMPVSKMHELLDRLTWWYARHEDDVLLYGRHRKNVSHLGDWLINSFAITEGYKEELLRVGDEVWNNLPMDRTIQQIQSHKRVFSTRLHPLLCALTSAQQVGYMEQRDAPDKTIVSGKFRSLLIDIFGRTYPEHEMWDVDKDKVMRYKKKVHTNKEELRQHVKRLLMGG